LEILEIFGVLLVAIVATSSFDWAQQEMQKEISSIRGVSPKQHFACNVGYTKQECQAATAVLRNALARYPVDALGEWTWILVRPIDWKRILSAQGIDPNDPGFSNLTKRKTLLDGSLVEAVSIRGIELRTVWHMPIEELLDLAIRHELAHALCNERDEFKANRIAISLRNGMPLSCRGSQQVLAESEVNKHPPSR